MFVNGFSIGVAAAVRDPSAVAGHQNRVEHGCQAARRTSDLNLAVNMFMDIRFPIGDDQDSEVAEASLD